MLRTWIIYSVTLHIAFIFFLCYKMWVSWYCLIILLLVPLFAFIVSRIAAITFTIEIPANTNIGSPAYMNLNTIGKASFFTFSRLQFLVTDHMSGTTKRLTVTVHDKGITKIPIDTKHCGAYTYELKRAAVYDPLGFFRRKVKINSTKEILVKPVPVIPDIMPDMFGFKAKNLRKTNKPNTEIYDIREYQKGDPIKSIHWKMSAKKDKYLIKESLEEYGGHSRVLLKLTPDRDQLDTHLGQILFTSRFFIEREVSHKIRIIPPDRSEIAFLVENTTDLEFAIAKILRIRIPDEEESDENE